MKQKYIQKLLIASNAAIIIFYQNCSNNEIQFSGHESNSSLSKSDTTKSDTTSNSGDNTSSNSNTSSDTASNNTSNSTPTSSTTAGGSSSSTTTSGSSAGSATGSSSGSTSGTSSGGTTSLLNVTTTTPVITDYANASFTVTQKNTSQVSYLCLKANGTSFSSGNLTSFDTNSSAQVNLSNIDFDVSCSVSAKAQDGSSLQKSVSFSVNCGNRLKTNGMCQDFSCQKYVDISPPAGNTSINVPARDSSGTCYYVQLNRQAIALSSSSLTNTVDYTVWSRNHGSGSTNHNPYLMPLSNGQLQFMIQSPDGVSTKGSNSRNIKISGDSLNADAPILVDNFFLVGLYPQTTTTLTDLSTYYHAYGTSDSSIMLSSATNYIALSNSKISSDADSANASKITLTPFGTGGTASVKALDITNDVSTGILYNLDMRAEDCGGSRQLSKIYLVFQ